MNNTARIVAIELRRVALPLRVPYRLSYHTFEHFEPIVVRVWDDAGRHGFAEGHISPGSSAETRAAGWRWCTGQAQLLPGVTVVDAMAAVAAAAARSPVAASSLLAAGDMLVGHELLEVRHAARLPILTPTNASNESGAAEIEAEVEQRLAEGFRTFKVKVGKDVAADATRVERFQCALAGRGTLRLDANRAYSREQGCDFVSRLEPKGIELFEQPCDSDDWDANAAVARVSELPLMLDEPICSLADVERAADIDGVGLCKVKLKRFGGVASLAAVLARIRELGMTPVLGDGLASEPGCWMEACVARSGIDNAGEFNGFLKPASRLFKSPLVFDSGCLVLAPGRPELDLKVLHECTIERSSCGNIPAGE